MISKKSVSLSEVARQANVSVSTVSRVLNNVPGVAESTRLITQETLQKLGYEPDRKLSRFFSRLHTGSSRTVAYVTSSQNIVSMQGNDGFYSRLQFPILHELQTRNYHLLLTNAEDVGPDGSLRCVREELVDGLIGLGIPEKLISQMAGNIPFVLLNQEYYEDYVDVVIPNVEWAAHEQIHYLNELGHRSIACFRLKPGSWQDRRFWNAYESTCSKLNIPLPVEYLAENKPDYSELNHNPIIISEFLKRVLNCSNPPTAIITHDFYAAPIIRQLEEMNLKVPQDISIIGYDDFTFGETASLALTTYRQNFEAMAEAATTMLLERLETLEFLLA